MRYKAYNFKRLLINNFKHLLFLIIPVIVLLIIVFILQVKSMHDNIIIQNASTIEALAYKTDSLLQGMVSAAKDTAYFNSTLALIHTDLPSINQQLINRLNDIQSQINFQIASNGVIDDIVIYFNERRYFINRNSGWQYDSAEFDTNLRPTVNYLLSLYQSNTDTGWIISTDGFYYYQIININYMKKGAVLVYAASHSIANILSALNTNISSQIHIVDNNGVIIANSNRIHQGESLTDLYSDYNRLQNSLVNINNNYLSFSSVRSGISQWNYVLITEENNYASSLKTTIYAAIIISFISLLLCIMLAYSIAQINCRPFELILDLLESPAVITNDSYTKNYKPYDDLGMISTLISQTKYKNMAMQSELTHKERILRDAQNAALQAQMSPHFLFNTLESINWLAIAKLTENNEVSRMISLLARLLRISMQTNHPLTTVKEEFEHAKLYIDIQKIRFEDQFNIVWNIDNASLKYATIRLSLQPILENAIIHGVKNINNGCILVSCQISEQNIIFSVSDNGPGLEPDKLISLNNSFINHNPQPESSIGLINLNTRIQLIFGDKYHLEIDSKPLVQTKISMSIPMLISSSAENEMNENLRNM